MKGNTGYMIDIVMRLIWFYFQMVWVSCEGENPADKEYLPKISLSPFPGFPAYYFPYTKVPGYRSPLVGVMLFNPQRKYTWQYFYVRVFIISDGPGLAGPLESISGRGQTFCEYFYIKLFLFYLWGCNGKKLFYIFFPLFVWCCRGCLICLWIWL